MFKPMKKPTKPVRQILEHEVTDLSYILETNYRIFDLAPRIRARFESDEKNHRHKDYELILREMIEGNIYIELEYGYEDYRVVFKAKYNEPDDAFDKRMDKYNSDLAEYNQFCDDYKEEIEDYNKIIELQKKLGKKAKTKKKVKK